VVLEIELSISCMLGKCSTTEIHSQYYHYFLKTSTLDFLADPNALISIYLDGIAWITLSFKKQSVHFWGKAEIDGCGIKSLSVWILT
jgi:hypothetical protein